MSNLNLRRQYNNTPGLITIRTVTAPGLTGWRGGTCTNSSRREKCREFPWQGLKHVAERLRSQRRPQQGRSWGKLIPNHSVPSTTLTGLPTGWNHWETRGWKNLLTGSQKSASQGSEQDGEGTLELPVEAVWHTGPHSHLPDYTKPQLKWTDVWQC